MRPFLLSIALAAVMAGGALAQTQQRVCAARFSDGRINTIVVLTENGKVVLTMPLDLLPGEVELLGCSTAHPLPEQADL